jgi:hypothetical protein
MAVVLCLVALLVSMYEPTEVAPLPDMWALSFQQDGGAHNEPIQLPPRPLELASYHDELHTIALYMPHAQPLQQTPPKPETRNNQQGRNALVALAMGMAIFSSSLALGIAYGIRRRIDIIAGPPPDDEDD